jgi:hypothetical protein
VYAPTVCLIPSVGEAVALDDEVVDTTLEEDVLVEETEELDDDFDVLNTTVEVLLTDVCELLVTELFDELETLFVDETTLLLLEKARELRRYISSLFPAPQYSYAFPGQMNEQSESVARVDDAARVFPQ